MRFPSSQTTFSPYIPLSAGGDLLALLPHRDVAGLLRPFQQLLEGHPVAAQVEGGVQLPVVDDGRLAGVIPLDFLLGAMVVEDTREMLSVGGVSGESRENPVFSAIRTRLPWLTVNLGTTFRTAAVISLFESTLAHFSRPTCTVDGTPNAIGLFGLTGCSGSGCQ